MVAGEAPRPAAGGGIALPAAFKEHASDGVRALANRLLRAEAERRPAAPRVVDDAARLLRKQPPAPEGSASIDSTRRDASNTSSMDDMSSTDVARALRIASASARRRPNPLALVRCASPRRRLLASPGP